MDALDRHRQELSKSFFGSAHMLAIALEVIRCADEDGHFTAPEVIERSHLSASTVHSMLNRLKRGRVVRNTKQRTPDRLAIYELRPHPIWDLVSDLDAEARAIGGGHLDELWDRRPIAADPPNKP